MIGTTAAMGSLVNGNISFHCFKENWRNTMSALILISAVLSTLVLSIVLSGMLILAIKDLVHAFSNKLTLPLGSLYKGTARKIQTLAPVA
jgi:hypothetical protein